MRVRFWGTRGSLAKPGHTTLRYGGNTSCVEVRARDGTLLVLDCGTGAHELGRSLVGAGAAPSHGHILITHTHWDHIQGFPFFAPLFTRGNEWHVYAPGGAANRLSQTLAGQMEYAYFPVSLEQISATVHYHDLVEGTFEIGPVRITARYLNHPGLTLGYRLEAGGAVLVYATDHEPHAPPTEGPGGFVHPEDQRHVEFLRGADLVIHDAQYTLAEYPARLTWGHSPAELAVDHAVAAGARRLVLFHHDPLRDDVALARLEEVCRLRAAASGNGTLAVSAAREGVALDVSGPAGALDHALVPPERARAADAPVAPVTVLLVDDDPAVLELLVETLQPEGFRLVTARDGDAALEVAGRERPDLVLLDWTMSPRDGLSVCRALRGAPDPHLRRVPVVFLTALMEPHEMAAGFEAGATDYITKPFKPAHVRSRVQAWLTRGRTASPDAS